MNHSGQIIGDVEFRLGDGPKMPIPHGPVEIETSTTEVTLSWEDGDSLGAAAMPVNEFKRYVSEGAIELDAGSADADREAVALGRSGAGRAP